MGYDRISSSFATRQALQYLNANQTAYAKSQAKLSTGKNLLTVSDDPVNTVRLLDLKSTQVADERYGKNIDNAQNELDVSDGALQSFTNIIQRAKELATQGASDTLGQANRDAVAKEIDSLINQAVQIGNTKIGEQYLFSGFKTTTPPFSRSGDVITYSGTPTNENWQRNTEIAPSVTLTTNVNGDNLLGSTTTNGSVFDTLVKLKQDLNAGNTANINSRLDILQGNLNNILAQSATVGAAQNQITLTRNRLADRKVSLDSQVSQIQDVDVAKVISDSNLQQTLYQASLSVTGKVLQTSLLNYI
jgi:flagellar hook-associated protein 3 FlgL